MQLPVHQVFYKQVPLSAKMSDVTAANLGYAADCERSEPAHALQGVECCGLNNWAQGHDAAGLRCLRFQYQGTCSEAAIAPASSSHRLDVTGAPWVRANGGKSLGACD